MRNRRSVLKLAASAILTGVSAGGFLAHAASPIAGKPSALRQRAGAKIEDYYLGEDGNNWTPAVRRAVAYLASKGGGQLAFSARDYVLERDGSNFWCARMDNNIEFIGEGQKTRLIQGAGMPINVAVIATGPADNVAVRNLLIHGNSEAQSNPFPSKHASGNHGVFCRGVAGAVFESLWFENMYGDGLYIGKDSRIAQDVLAVDCRVRGAERHGFTVGQGAKGVTLRRCSTEQVHALGLDIEPFAPDIVEGLLIDDCDLRSGTGGAKLFSLSAYRHGGEGNRDFTIKNSRLDGPVHLHCVNDLKVIGNQIRASGLASFGALEIRGTSSRVVIENNQIVHEGADADQGILGVVNIYGPPGQPRDISLINNVIEAKCHRMPLYSSGVGGRLLVQGNTLDAHGQAPCAYLRALSEFESIIWKSNRHINGNPSGIRIQGGEVVDGTAAKIGTLEMSDNEFGKSNGEAGFQYGLDFDPQDAQLFRNPPKISGNKVNGGQPLMR